MLRINRIRTEITTENGVYGCDIPFSVGLNFLSSEENTCGKSSILAAIYYCLGMEEILGGKGEKSLTSVFKTTIEDHGTLWSVLQSCVYLEINNGTDTVTLFRAAKMENRSSRIITVYFGNLDDIHSPDIQFKDTYVHFPLAAERVAGFHSFLEDFLHLKLPRVTSSDNRQRKLYLQLVFSCIFIEQKHGWSGLFSGMPILGIKESKKRVIEFILNLDTFEQDKLKEELRLEEANITQSWKSLYSTLQIAARRESCDLVNFPMQPKILSDIDIGRIAIQKNQRTISDVIISLKAERDSINVLKPKVIDNFDDFHAELKKTEESISEFNQQISQYRSQLLVETGTIESLEKSLETIEIDLVNNKDAARLRSLGSSLGFDFANDRCPVCHQKINDTLLPESITNPVMGIDANISHLEAQQKMLLFALESHRYSKSKLNDAILDLEKRILGLRHLAQSIRNDLYSVDDSYSETVIYKKVTFTQQIEALMSLQQLHANVIENLILLSSRWKAYLEKKKSAVDGRLTKADKEKLNLLKCYFINNLKAYGYKSIHNLDAITISDESYLPLFEGFDMKFDSSASDNIRVIWAFTMALLQVSLEKNGNHPCILIFDEPDQQSTVINDMKAFFDSILKLKGSCQVIIGLTLKDSDTKKVIEELQKDQCLQHIINHKAFYHLSQTAE